MDLYGEFGYDEDGDDEYDYFFGQERKYDEWVDWDGGV